MIAAINFDALGELAWAAPLAVLTVTISWGFVIRGTTLALEARRAGRRIPAIANAAVAIAGFALFAATLGFGLIIMISKG